jgi:hypothetical protein
MDNKMMYCTVCKRLTPQTNASINSVTWRCACCGGYNRSDVSDMMYPSIGLIIGVLVTLVAFACILDSMGVIHFFRKFGL